MKDAKFHVKSISLKILNNFVFTYLVHIMTCYDPGENHIGQKSTNTPTQDGSIHLRVEKIHD